MPIQIVLLVPLGELPPGSASQLPIFGQPGHPDQGLPGGGGHPDQGPIFHPGHPDHGLPSRPGGGRPDQGLPGGPGRPSQPINIPGLPDLPSQGLPPGTPVPPGSVTLPEPPPDLAQSVIVAVHKPGDTSWTVTSFDTTNKPDQGLPPQSPPTATPQ